MTPSDGVVTGDAWTYARPGEEYGVPAKRRPGRDRQAAAGESARWWDPREGGAQDAGPGPSFTAPGPGDWALHVRVP
ncbi:hypothetical protein [Nannocystis sp.]|uniref:hypothetical protein n=1 Tax=Nannocystis sp. TaxID=1962667 RepID=UPI0025E6D232|nr:hypothetical protein [Nannocystis sp.]MBK7828813.1 hypothetical protein [Nannocystis sp.]